MGKSTKEVAAQVETAKKQTVQSRFAPKGYVNHQRYDDKNYVAFEGIMPDGENLWLAFGAIFANPTFANLYTNIKKFYNRKNDELVKDGKKKVEFNDMQCAKSILKHLAFGVEFVFDEEQKKWVMDNDTLVIGAFDEETDAKIDLVDEGDEEAVKFFYNAAARKVFSF